MGTLSTKKFIKNNAGALTEEAALTTSAGASDADKLPALNASGILDASIVNSKTSSAGAGDAGKVVALDGAGRIDSTMMPVGIGIGIGIGADAPNIFAQRNGTNPQTHRWYNTYTDASNYERGFARWNSNVFEVGTEAGGTGTARGIRFSSPLGGAGYGWTFYCPNSTGNRIRFLGIDRSAVLAFSSSEFGSVGGLFSYMDYAAGPASQHALKHLNINGTIGYFGLIGAAAGVLQINNAIGRGNGYGASVELWEMTAPAAPAANGVRIYAEDDGTGKTRLMARFATGASVHLAIEP
jgi:hypothetical protein